MDEKSEQEFRAPIDDTQVLSQQLFPSLNQYENILLALLKKIDNDLPNCML